MSEAKATAQLNNRLPPRAGLMYAIAVSTTPGSLNLLTVDNQTQNAATQDALKVGLDDVYIDVGVDSGANVGLIFGSSSAAVTGGNAPVIATAGTNAAGVCWVITGGTVQRFKLQHGVDTWVGFVGSAAGVLRIYRSSPYQV